MTIAMKPRFDLAVTGEPMPRVFTDHLVDATLSS
jgi:hypothetical protein